MSITIFEDKNCNGASRTVSRDIADLQGQRADKPSSIRLTSDDEEVLLFKNDDWHGGVLYLRGPKTVSDLGEKDELCAIHGVIAAGLKPDPATPV